MTETRHPVGSDLDNRHRFGARARHAGDSPTAVCTADIGAPARSLRSGLQARVYQAWICYRKASARGSPEIAARSPGMVVVGAVVAPTIARFFPVIHLQRRRSGMALVYPPEPSLARELKRGDPEKIGDLGGSPELRLEITGRRSRPGGSAARERLAPWGREDRSCRDR